MKNKKVVILVLIALIFILVGIGIISYDDYSKNNNNDSPVTEKEYELLDINSKLVKELFYLTRGTNSNISSLFYGTKYDNLYYRNNNININEQDNSFKLLLSFLTLNKEKYIYNDDSTVTIKSDDLKEQYNKIFINTDSYENEDIYSDCPSDITYDSTLNRYQFFSGCGGTNDTGYINKIVEAKKYEEKIEIYETVAFYFLDTENNKTIYYSDPNYIEFLVSFSSINEFKIEEYLETLHTYKYTFVKEGQSYKFSEVNMIN